VNVTGWVDERLALDIWPEWAGKLMPLIVAGCGITTEVRTRDLVVRGVGQTFTPPGTAKDSIRAAMFTASPVSRSGSTITSPTGTPMNRNVVRRELPLDRDRGEHRIERAREHAHAAVAEPLDDRPVEGVVVGLERTPVPVALVDSLALVRLDQRRVADHVGEHHGDEPTVELLTHISADPTAHGGKGDSVGAQLG
jgi:hypothetical protein